MFKGMFIENGNCFDDTQNQFKVKIRKKVRSLFMYMKPFLRFEKKKNVNNFVCLVCL